jgi:hypothetical protein
MGPYRGLHKPHGAPTPRGFFFAYMLKALVRFVFRFFSRSHDMAASWSIDARVAGECGSPRFIQLLT